MLKQDGNHLKSENIFRHPDDASNDKHLIIAANHVTHLRPYVLTVESWSMGGSAIHHPTVVTAKDHIRIEKEILTVKTRDKVSYSEAKRIVLKRINNETTTYAGIVGESRKPPNTLNLNKRFLPVMPGNNTERSTNHIKQSTAQSPFLAQPPTTSSNAATTSNQFITGIHTPMPTLDLTCVHTSRGRFFIALPGALLLHTHTHKQLCTGDFFNDYTHSYICPRLIACTKTFFFHVYRSVSLTRMPRYTQLAYLFHQCATSLLSRDGRIADCTVRHPGVERPFSSFLPFYNHCFNSYLFC